MSAFHRIDDVRAMPAQRFINFALRLVAYKGIIRALAEAEQHEQSQSGTSRATASTTRRPAMGGDIRQNREVASDATTLMTDPAFAGMFEKGGASA